MADKQNQSRGLSIEIDVDVSEALTGLKAVERQAKKATQALKETETTAQRLQAHLDANGAEYYAGIRQATTKALSEELAMREGITTYELGGYGNYANLRMVSADGGDSVFIEGPATITVNID